HQCRHTYASMLIHAGTNPKAVQTYLGHSKIQTTFDIYGHLFPGSRDEVRRLMDGYLAGEGEMTGAQALEDWRISGASPDSTDAEGSFIQHSESHAFRVGEPDQQKTPRRGGGALLGLLQGGEICISIYVDPWEVGGPLMCRCGARCGMQREPWKRRRTQPRSSYVDESSTSCESLNQNTNVCAIYV
ncbi:MAG TPA: tyrosine-type recombinase/integrase, partial [Solirubrobacterales bacterium]|nr:tyrosine-type recombinase/integrase [Solirubrobacterales bacterium]